MAGRKNGLGRGLDALFPEKTAASKEPVRKTVTKAERTEKKVSRSVKAKEENHDAEEKKTAMMVKISSVEPNVNQPRKQFDEDALVELSESIKQYGILQPLLVSDKKDYYEIIAGERRWRAAKMAGLKEVPVIVKEFTEQELVEISLIENIQREDLNPIEEASAYQRLIDEFHLKHEEIAERVAKSRSAITNSMRLLKLDKRVQMMLVEGEISGGHARTLLALEDQELQFTAAERIIEHKLSVRETEKLVKDLLKPKKSGKEQNVPDEATALIYKNLEEKIRGILGTKVSINRKDENRGKIEIEYYSMDELERLMDLFGKM